MIQFSWTLEVCKVFSSEKIFHRTLNLLEYCCKINKQTNKNKTKQNTIRSYSEIRCIALCVWQTSKEFKLFLFRPLSQSGPLREKMFTFTSSKGHSLWFVIGGFRSVLIVSCFKVRCFVIVLFPALIDYIRLLRRFFCSFLFLSLARIKQRLPPSFDKNPLTIAISFAIFLNSLESFSAKLGEHVTLWFALTPPSVKCLTGQNNPKSLWSL